MCPGDGRQGRLPLRFARVNPTPRRLGAARRQCRFRLLTRNARKLSAILHDPPNHTLEFGGSFRAPGFCERMCICPPTPPQRDERPERPAVPVPHSTLWRRFGDGRSAASAFSRGVLPRKPWQGRYACAKNGLGRAFGRAAEANAKRRMFLIGEAFAAFSKSDRLTNRAFMLQ